MDDRAVSVLENYDLKVLRTWKGRGAILFETNQGTRILKEYIGPKEKVLLQDKLVHHLKEQGFSLVDEFEKNKEDEILSLDFDKKSYIVKEYFGGKECNIWDIDECKAAVAHLADLHRGMKMNSENECILLPAFCLEKEYEKHNKELKRVRNFIRAKSQKTDFEIYLLHYYDYFYEKALSAYEKTIQIDWTPFYTQIKQQGSLCHGDYQYHNILMGPKGIAVINFEKYVLDSRIRDLYLFMRKILEKNMWSEQMGKELLATYEKENSLNELEMQQLYFRFLYPEKFWKIVNFYFNSGKSWLPMRHMEKLQKLILQEEAKEHFLNSFFF